MSWHLKTIVQHFACLQQMNTRPFQERSWYYYQLSKKEEENTTRFFYILLLFGPIINRPFHPLPLYSHPCPPSNPAHPPGPSSVPTLTWLCLDRRMQFSNTSPLISEDCSPFGKLYLSKLCLVLFWKIGPGNNSILTIIITNYVHF